MTAARPKVASLAEPSAQRMASAVVTLAYMSREAMSIAERIPEQLADDESASRLRSQSEVAANCVKSATSYIRAALALINELPQLPKTAQLIDAETWLRRAEAGADATLGHIHVFREYPVRRADQADLAKRDKQRLVWRAAAREARADTHRALAELCEALPGAYEMDSDV